MRGWPGSCLLCHWQTGGPSLNVRTMGCWRIVCKGHGRAGRGPAPSSGTGDQGWVQDETSRQEDAEELESNRARPMAETITLHHSSAAGLDRQAWSGWRSPITGPAVRRSAQPRRGQVVCDPVLLDRRPAKLGSITVRFNDNFRRLDLVLGSKKLQWQHFPGLPEPAAAFLRVRKETGDQRPVFRGMTADFQVG